MKSMTGTHNSTCDQQHCPTFRDGAEPFRLQGAPTDITLYDYWRWAGSDLLVNIQRGVLAEFIVARALESETLNSPRAPWEGYDIQYRDRTIEVKCAAYVQAWHQNDSRPSEISFGITPDSAYRDSRANAYVFCVLGERGVYPDPMDLAQWKFYVFMSAVLPDQKTIALGKLQDLIGHVRGFEVGYDGLRIALEDAFERYPSLYG